MDKRINEYLELIHILGLHTEYNIHMYSAAGAPQIYFVHNNTSFLLFFRYLQTLHKKGMPILPQTLKQMRMCKTILHFYALFVASSKARCDMIVGVQTLAEL